MAAKKSGGSWLQIFTMGAVWAMGVGIGTWYLARYAATPGQGPVRVGAHAQWPSDSRVAWSRDQPLFLVFAHPQCPCSEATMGELERLLPFFKDKVGVKVLFVQPAERSPAWVQGSLWERVLAMPGVDALVDEGGYEADLFGAQSSGQTFLYGKKGELIFSGGITPARGHMGDSRGRDFLLSWLQGKNLPLVSATAFGCALKKREGTAVK